MSETRIEEGYVATRGFKTWYRRLHPARTTGKPILLLHGGPGATSETMAPLEALVDSGHSVIRYDQLGCGRSERPGDPDVWSLELFLEELASLRAALGLAKVHLVGHSWGGQLALEHVLSGADGVRSLVLGSSPVSAKLWAEETRRLRRDLPPIAQGTLVRCERRHRPRTLKRRRTRPGVSARRIALLAPLVGLGFRLGAMNVSQRVASAMSYVPAFRQPAYQLAQAPFLMQHICRLASPPIEMCRAGVGWNALVYEIMWGPSEFLIDGHLRDWEAVSRLHLVKVPTLVTSGRFDAATPSHMKLLTDGIPGSRSVVFDESAHMAHIEEPERYRAALSVFFAAHDDEGGR